MYGAPNAWTRGFMDRQRAAILTRAYETRAVDNQNLAKVRARDQQATAARRSAIAQQQQAAAAQQQVAAAAQAAYARLPQVPQGPVTNHIGNLAGNVAAAWGRGQQHQVPTGPLTTPPILQSAPAQLQPPRDWRSAVIHQFPVQDTRPVNMLPRVPAQDGDRSPAPVAAMPSPDIPIPLPSSQPIMGPRAAMSDAVPRPQYLPGMQQPVASIPRNPDSAFPQIQSNKLMAGPDPRNVDPYPNARFVKDLPFSAQPIAVEAKRAGKAIYNAASAVNNGGWSSGMSIPDNSQARVQTIRNLQKQANDASKKLAEIQAKIPSGLTSGARISDTSATKAATIRKLQKSAADAAKKLAKIRAATQPTPWPVLPATQSSAAGMIQPIFLE